MARGSTTQTAKQTTIPIPPKDVQLTAKRDNIGVYWDRTKTTDGGMIVGFADDDRSTRPYKVGDIVGRSKGISVENSYGIWVEITVRAWKKRVFDRVREDRTAYYLLQDDPVIWNGYEAAKKLEEDFAKQKELKDPVPKGEGQNNTLLYVLVGIVILLVVRASFNN